MITPTKEFQMMDRRRSLSYRWKRFLHVLPERLISTKFNLYQAGLAAIVSLVAYLVLNRFVD